MIGLNLRALLHLLWKILVMRQRMMRFRNADLRIRSPVLLAPIHKGGNARQIGLEREQLEVIQKPDVPLETIRNAYGTLDTRHVRGVLRTLLFSLLDTPLDIAKRFDIVAHFPVVACAEALLQRLYAIRDRIQDAPVLRKTRRSHARIRAVIRAE